MLGLFFQKQKNNVSILSQYADILQKKLRENYFLTLEKEAEISGFTIFICDQKDTTRVLFTVKEIYQNELVKFNDLMRQESNYKNG